MQRLLPAIILSIALHLAGYGLWLAWGKQVQMIVISSHQQGQPLRVALVEAAPPVSSIPPATRQTERIKSTPTQQPKPRLKHTQLTRAQPRSNINRTQQPVTNNNVTTNTISVIDTAKPERSVEKNTTTQAQTNEFNKVHNDMLKELHTQFQARFRYPMQARKHGWQGKVILALSIERNGQITGIEIRQSSGYQVLDHNAIKTFRLIGSVSDNFKTQLTESHQLSIPVIYQLSGS